jgi:furin
MLFLNLILLNWFFTLINSFEDKPSAETVIKLKKNLRLSNKTFARLERIYNLHFERQLFDDYYIFSFKNHSQHRRDLSYQLHQNLSQDPQIEWFEIQRGLARYKRDFLDDYFSSKSDIFNPIDMLVEKFNRAKYKLSLDDFAKNNTKALYSKCEASLVSFNDPQWKNQWYMNDGCAQGHDSNITTAWRLGYTGQGIVLSIIDDGLEANHSEIFQNYDPEASFDFNDNDPYPAPRYDTTDENKHGTRCAGQIVAKVNNSRCGVGVAFGSKIGGIRLLDGKVTDRLEAEALIFNIDHIDIFSASWGPVDDGKTLDRPGELSRQAFLKGITQGRQGKGSIYVWAAGNGGRYQDNCNCDGYTSSVYTITIGGVTQSYNMPSYSEKCAAILASTFSSGSVYEAGIVAPDLHDTCTTKHTGTSASAPIAAGVIALALSANANLTWRDVQYLIVYTSSRGMLKADDWSRNGVGRYFSHNYGYGLINGGRMVEAALSWPMVGKQLGCTMYFKKLKQNAKWISGTYQKLT